MRKWADWQMNEFLKTSIGNRCPSPDYFIKHLFSAEFSECLRICSGNPFMECNGIKNCNGKRDTSEANWRSK